jgi:hypothetical protein
MIIFVQNPLPYPSCPPPQAPPSTSPSLSRTTPPCPCLGHCFGVQEHKCSLNKVFTKTRFSNHTGKRETGWGTLLPGFLRPRCSRPATTGTQQSSTGCSRDLGQHMMDARAKRSGKPLPEVLLEPDLGVDDPGVHVQDVPGVLQALGQGVVTSHQPHWHCTAVHRLPAQYMAEELVFRTVLSYWPLWGSIVSPGLLPYR